MVLMRTRYNTNYSLGEITNKFQDCDHHLIILSGHQHGYHRPSISIPPYRSSFPVGPQATPRILTELLYVGSSRPPCFCMAMSGVHKSTSLMSLSLFLLQCPAYLVRLTWIVFLMGSRWPYSCCFVGGCFQDLFNIARSILV